MKTMYTYRNIQAGSSPHSQGFMLIELLIMTGIMTACVLSIVALTLQMEKQRSQLTTPTLLDGFRRNLLALTLDEASWQQTINAARNTTPGGTDMRCLQTGASTLCTFGAPAQQFALFDGAGNPFYDPATQGVSASGTTCPYTGASDTCPFQYNLTWAPVCPPSTCPPSSDMQVVITVTLTYSPVTHQLSLNTNNYVLAPIYRMAN